MGERPSLGCSCSEEALSSSPFALIHRSAWKESSQKSISTILHGLPLCERRMAYFPALELVAKHKILEQ
jgi:hypothetical protein